MEQQYPQNGGDGGGDGVGPDQQRAVDAAALDFAVGEDGEQEGDAHREKGDGEAEAEGAPHRFDIERIGEQVDEVFEADELGFEAECVLPGQAAVDRLPGGPEEE